LLIFHAVIQLSRNEVNICMVGNFEVDHEKRGQFPHMHCECHIQEPYGFVPEAGCPLHDNMQFMDFVELLERRAKGVEHKKCAPGCPTTIAVTPSMRVATATWDVAKERGASRHPA
jgi:hypothetical protein